MCWLNENETNKQCMAVNILLIEYNNAAHFPRNGEVACLFGFTWACMPGKCSAWNEFSFSIEGHAAVICNDVIQELSEL